ncbi:metal ABC transporter solute-binding protein, Zn/Mn family [Treponema parvum]|uniref:metal ABC transporter solute-binding protein, Zn/Mn family n=1 Tax=Treponema parvum TaxID=138851 RepID=UPI001AEBC425|nr:zinc ABC transporter substrate-binding protein [Treponema parvum]QTQ16946.1 ABC transporter substrate-binding protein [Treponema parvum]
MKKIMLIASFVTAMFCVFAEVKTSQNTRTAVPRVVASTSWTAAFADIAGADKVEIIAPANLRHPPEYEVTVSDIQKILDCDFFIYAGFERMMKTLGGVTESSKMIKILSDNSVSTVTSETKKIAEILHTEGENEKRLKAYVKTIEDGKAEVQKRGLNKLKVLCNKHQIYLARELGFEVDDVFGPGPVTAMQIAKAKDGGYALIIDNIHNPQGKALVEVLPNAKYVVWRNFPDRVERNALLNVVQKNIDSLLKAFK